MESLMHNLRAPRREAASLAPRMSIVYRTIDQLKPDPANPRRHSKKQIRQIANSIEGFGFNVPPDRGRMRAIGWKPTPARTHLRLELSIWQDYPGSLS
jgi:hypothetical protein